MSRGEPPPRRHASIDFGAHANRHEWPPILYAVTAAAGLALERFLPLASDWVPAYLRILGAAAAVLALALAVTALLGFRHAGTPVRPTARAENLVASGVYRRTRNPMYLSAVVAYAGFGLAWPALWFVVLAAAMARALDRLAIRREERHLEERFGEAYRRYRAEVPRWL